MRKQYGFILLILACYAPAALPVTRREAIRARATRAGQRVRAAKERIAARPKAAFARRRARYTMPASKWVNPYTLNPNLRLNEICLIAAHNSFAFKNPPHGADITPGQALLGTYHYAQQQLNIPQQLALGVRMLDLDTYVDTDGPYEKGEVFLTHGGFEVDKWLRTGGLRKKHNPPMKLSHALGDVHTFLKNNSNEVMMISFENYVEPKANPTKLIAAIQQAGLERYVLKTSDWDPVAQGGWPTLAWMKQHNKRLILWVPDYNVSPLLWQMGPHIASTNFGTLDVQKAAQEAGRSIGSAQSTRYLFAGIFIPTFLVPLPGGKSENIKEEWKGMRADQKRKYTQSVLPGFLKTINRARVNSVLLTQFLAALQTRFGRQPNILYLDYVDQGTAFELVNAINRKSAQNAAYRAKWFGRFKGATGAASATK